MEPASSAPFYPQSKQFTTSWDRNEPTEDFFAFLEQSAHSITSFTMLGAYIGSVSLPLFTRCLQSLPQLETLSLQFGPNAGIYEFTFLRALGAIDNNRTLIPNLKRLQIYYLRVNASVLLADMLEERASLHMPVPSVHVSFVLQSKNEYFKHDYAVGDSESEASAANEFDEGVPNRAYDNHIKKHMELWDAFSSRLILYEKDHGGNISLSLDDHLGKR
jgi:hypothetical protein